MQGVAILKDLLKIGAYRFGAGEKLGRVEWLGHCQIICHDNSYPIGY